YPRSGVLLRVYPPAAAILTVALPANCEIAGRIHHHAGIHLIAGRGRVGPELTALRQSQGVVALGVDTPAAAVLTVAGPGDDKLADRIHGHRGISLVARRGGVDAELPALG